jgi:hypothetical protein
MIGHRTAFLQNLKNPMVRSRYDFRILHSKICTQLKLSHGLQEQQGPDLGTKNAITFSKNSLEVDFYRRLYRIARRVVLACVYVQEINFGKVITK